MHPALMPTGAHCDITPLRSFRSNDTLTPTEPIPPPPTVQLALILSIVLQESEDFKHKLYVMKRRADCIEYLLDGISASQQESPRYSSWTLPSQNPYSNPSSTSRQSSTQSAQPASMPRPASAASQTLGQTSITSSSMQSFALQMSAPHPQRHRF